MILSKFKYQFSINLPKDIYENLIGHASHFKEIYLQREFKNLGLVSFYSRSNSTYIKENEIKINLLNNSYLYVSGDLISQFVSSKILTRYPDRPSLFTLRTIEDTDDYVTLYE